MADFLNQFNPMDQINPLGQILMKINSMAETMNGLQQRQPMPEMPQQANYGLQQRAIPTQPAAIPQDPHQRAFQAMKMFEELRQGQYQMPTQSPESPFMRRYKAMKMLENLNRQGRL